MATAMVMENCLYTIPVEPSIKAMGTNTAAMTMATPTSAPVIWRMDFFAAAFGVSFSSRMRRSTFSTTTIASSTRRPMASTIPNMVSVLMTNPQAASTKKVPRRTTGMAIVGITVARRLCKKRYMTKKTRTMASSSVLKTALMEISTKSVESYG